MDSRLRPLANALVLALALSLLAGCAPDQAPSSQDMAAEALPSQPAPPVAAPAAAGDPVASMSEPPPMPKGYASNEEVMAAIARGEVTLLNADVDVPAGVIALDGIEYSNVDGISLQLDLAHPSEGEGPFPGLIFIHGGSWKGGEREIYHLYTYAFAQHGYVAATVSYRLSGQAMFPAAVQDIKSAVRWMRTNADSYRIDPERIAVIGASAGGHLAMMAGYAAGAPELEGEVGHTDVSSAVQAVVNFYGPYDLTAEIAQESSDVRRFLGAAYDENPEIYRTASPMHYLNEGAPPTLIFHGTIDDVVPVEQADRLAARLDELGIPYVYERFEGWPHTMDLAKPVNERCRWFMYRFFEEHLGAGQ